MDRKVDEIVAKYSAYSTDLVESVQSLHQTVQWMQKFVSEYDYNEETPFNGFRSFIKIIDRLFTLLQRKTFNDTSKSWFFLKNNSKKSAEIDELVKLTQALQFMSTHYVRIRDELVKENNNHRQTQRDMLKQAFCFNSQENHRVTSEAFKNANHLANAYGKYSNFFYGAEYRRSLRVFMAFFSFAYSKSVVSYFFNIFTRPIDFIREQYLNGFMNFDIDLFIRRMRIIEAYLPATGNLIRFGLFPVHKRKRITITVPQVWRIATNGQIERLSKPVEHKITALWTYSSFDVNNEALILYAHGGGFCLGSTEGHEVTTGTWAEHLKTVPVLSIEYALAPESKFPAALQQLLDIHLFLTSGHEAVKQQFSFHPKKIIFAGDSAGGNLVLALTMLLNDIKRQFNQPIPFPVSVISIYSATLLQLAYSAARLSIAFEVLIPLTLFFGLAQSYTGFHHECEHRKSDPTDENGNQIESKALNGKILHWYQCEKCIQAFESFNEAVKMPYLSPIFYEHLDELSGITLNSIIGEFDPLLDENIVLSKLWKGKVTLDVFEDAGHGFLHIGSKDLKVKGNETCIRRIQESLNQ